MVGEAIEVIDMAVAAGPLDHHTGKHALAAARHAADRKQASEPRGRCIYSLPSDLR